MLRFDGRVALVTGAGRGLGRAYAKYLASRGAQVVVNDLGGSAVGVGADSAPAQDVVKEIEAEGGHAVANFDNVAEAPEAIVRTAIDEFGRLDIVVNNAGINRSENFGKNSLEIIKQHMSVHFFGAAGVTAAAWDHLVASGVGRVINACSPTLVGFENQTPYVSAKGAIFAFTRTLAMEALKVGIRVNAIAPTAATRMSDEMDAPEEFKQFMRDNYPQSLVAPVVAYLAHEDCAITGETILAQGGEVQRLSLSETTGMLDKDLTPEAVAENIETILDPGTSTPIGLVGAEGTKDALSMP
ncbi:SDR family NAD(P)-dependent oxidoreductase [Brevibacterium sp. VCM10]|uniref:SDR family NAD(P)-dependent oxidoreductase n=1 Tax=Brevibacterium sp. VCM10 TaxID=1381751 RepID=UPI0004718A76|nr:SDR family NAD(P)-dependent oxidoreductase [Brevibacterium sp. VCM10]